MSKSKDKIRVSFPSASAESVAGSQVLIQFGKGDDKQTILVECGLIQGEPTLLKEYQANTKKFAFKPKDLTAVFVAHSHIDHLGGVPRLYKEGCIAPLIIPSHTKDIMKEMLLDSARIMQRDAEDLTRKFNKEYPPVYTEDDVKTTVQHMVEYKRNERFEFSDTITFEFVPSGHIIGACQLILWIKNNGSIKKIVITSDLGNKSLPQYYIEDFEPIQSANLFIGETTYCNSKRSISIKDREKDLEKIKAAVTTTCIDNHGSILMPAFALQRFQCLLTYLYDLFHEDIENGKIELPKIYAASPLACKLCNLFDENIYKEEDKKKWEEVRNWKQIEFINDFDTLEGKVNSLKPAIYVCSAGMLNAGYSKFVASKLLPRSNNMILFCGFMAQNTLGFKIKEQKNKTISIDGQQIHARCNVMALKSFTSHMQHDDLLDYYSSINADKLAMVHGEFDDKVLFCKELQEKISKRNRSGKVICVNKSTELLI